MKYYTGIGSRDVTEEEFNTMSHLARTFANCDWTLRSGGAQGADSAFELGCAEENGHAEIYIPWKGFGKKFENNNCKRYIPSYEKFNVAKDYLIEEGIIPWFERMKQGAQKLHGRNYYQCKGLCVDSSIMVYCADDEKNGVPKGGTRTAILLAISLDIPTYNIRVKEQYDKIHELVYLMKCDYKGERK